MGKGGGITNRFVLFLGSGNQAGQNHQTITKLEKTAGKGGDVKPYYMLKPFSFPYSNFSVPAIMHKVLDPSRC